MTRHRPGQVGRRRPGAVFSAELLMILPVVMFLLYGLIQINQILVARQALFMASQQGARAASVGASVQQAEIAALRPLAAFGPLANSAVAVTIIDNGGGNGVSKVAVVQVSAPVGLVLVAVPGFIRSALQDQLLIGTTVMRVE